MAVRNESVRVSLQDDFTSKAARMTAAAAMFKRELNSIDGKRVSTELDDTARSVDRLGQSSRRGGPEIDKLSGRVRLFADAALTLGPALIPLTAATLPALTGALAGLGSAAGAIGVSLLAFNGLGDALKAIDQAQLEPTVENIEKMRIELEKMGPAGAEFAHFLDDLEPQLHSLQNLARAGLFPGVEDGITDLLTRLPLVRDVVNRLSQEMGRLAEDAGRSLSSDEWTPIFEYVRRTAAPTMDDFARATGNVALGVANLLVAFGPLTKDFTGGLLEATRAFAEWSKGLDENQSFQNFLAYVREAGPQAAHLLEAIAKAFAGLVKAAAPWGEIVLPVLTATANLFATIASSPIGPGLYAAAAGMVAFNRAAALAERTTTRFQASWSKLSTRQIGGGVAGGLGLLALSLTDLDEKMGVANTAMGAMAGLMVGGPWGAAIGAGIGAVKDFHDAQSSLNDEMERAQDIARSGTLGQQRAEYERLAQEIHDTKTAQDDFFRNGSVNFSGQAVKGWLFGTRQQEDALSELAGAMRNTGGLADLFAADIGQTRTQLLFAADAAQDFSGALAALNGWFDKRESIRQYQQSIDDLKKSLKDGFTREDAANVDAVGRSILQVAQNIKDRGLRADFLANARQQLVNLAEHAAPKAAAALQSIIDKFDQQGLTRPKNLELSVDTSKANAAVEATKRHVKTTLDFISKQRAEPTIDADDNPFTTVFRGVRESVRQADAMHATPTVSVDPGNSFSVLGNIRSELSRIVSKTITVTVNRVGNALQGSFDTGGFTGRGGHLEPAGIVHRNEVVIPERYVRRDWNLLRSRYGDLPGFAGGGLVSDTYTSRFRGDDGTAHANQTWHDMAAAADGATRGLKGLKAELSKAEKALDRERSKLEQLTSQRDSLAGSATSALLHDPFGNGLAGFEAQTAADSADSAAMLAALQTLVRNGLDPKGALFQALAASGDVNTAQQMAALTSQQLFAEQAAFNQSHSLAGQVGQFAGNQAFGEAIREQRDATKELREEVRHLRREINQMGKHVKDGAKDGAYEGTWHGTKDGHEGRNKRVSAASATQGRPVSR